jgi:diguanylate cyclase (GGDEF)-like protein
MDYLVTGFSPINNPDTGEVVGVVGVDFSYSTIVPLLNRIRNVIFIGYLSIVLILSIIFYNLFESRVEALNTDYLTGLFSKRYFDRHLQFNILDTKFRNQPMSLIMMDIDAFKDINDHFGHQMGDKILKAVGDIVRRSIRTSDICARYGGDEFSIILPNAEISHSLLVAEQIRDGMRELTVLKECEKILPVSISIGIAAWEKGMAGEDLVNHADLALYQSKRESNGKISVFNKEEKKKK